MELKTLFIYIMGMGYIWVGFQHFIDTSFFLKIMPPSFPLHKESVYVSGALEILFGSGIIFKKTRFYASWGIILLLIAVYPANIYLALSDHAQQAIGVSSFFACWVRLPIQLVLIGLAYFSSKI
jgi:uncharacterized membrane protein